MAEWRLLLMMLTKTGSKTSWQSRTTLIGMGSTLDDVGLHSETIFASWSSLSVKTLTQSHRLRKRADAHKISPQLRVPSVRSESSVQRRYKAAHWSSSSERIGETESLPKRLFTNENIFRESVPAASKTDWMWSVFACVQCLRDVRLPVHFQASLSPTSFSTT